jgi:hypothetical protein
VLGLSAQNSSKGQCGKDGFSHTCDVLNG